MKHRMCSQLGSSLMNGNAPLHAPSMQTATTLSAPTLLAWPAINLAIHSIDFVVPLVSSDCSSRPPIGARVTVTINVTVTITIAVKITVTIAVTVTVKITVTVRVRVRVTVTVT